MTATEFALAVGILIGVVLGFTAGLIEGIDGSDALKETDEQRDERFRRQMNDHD